MRLRILSVKCFAKSIFDGSKKGPETGVRTFLAVTGTPLNLRTLYLRRTTPQPEEVSMPMINGVTVTNTNTGATWNTQGMATVQNNGQIFVNGAQNDQPPVGFLNNPQHNFTIAGNRADTGAAYNSGNVHPDGPNSEPPLIFAFQ